MSEGFGAFVRAHGGEGRLVVQPRMGFGDPQRMREGLAATRAADALTVGTITLDAHTRVGHLRAVERALRDGSDLNGYPIVSHEESVTRWVLSAASGPGFPVQVRHGSAAPADIFRTLTRLGLGAGEGGPVSYRLPYGRTPLAESVRNWRESCEVVTEPAALEYADRGAADRADHRFGSGPVRSPPPGCWRICRTCAEGSTTWPWSTAHPCRSPAHVEPEQARVRSPRVWP
ncbi:hypothetical protein EEJ42_11175 [Streptomyces botrytidirepellens]|uniref:Uncharacterized protein n=1 Tax=Streptomyces botrytidirepellens TaxID=2486417 RepID=A0A3M8WJL1_9ACTN|nr:hypothetical protein EEJ42_11175 [Streptomyces botrytidirepellens]